MRRKEREIKDKAVLEQLLMQAQICRLGMYDGTWPYVVPVNMGYDAGCIYFHSFKKGKKIDILRQYPKVCFEVDSDVEIVTGELPCNWTTNYKSVIGFGTAVLVADEAEKLAGMRILMRRHGGPVDGFKAEHFPAMAVVRIDIDSMTGKSNPPYGEWG